MRKIILLLAALPACAPAVREPAAPAPAGSPTVAEAIAFVDSAEALLYTLGVSASRAAWVQATYITDDTEELAAEANARFLAARTPLGLRAAEYADLDLPYETARKLSLLRLALAMPSPVDPEATAELSRLAASLESAYGRGEYCPPGGGECLGVEELSEIMANSRDPEELLRAWLGWRTISPPMRDDYTRFVDLMNQGARDLGFPDVGTMWRLQYDMPPDEFAREMDRLWEQVRPLYESLHCYVRAELRKEYGSDAVPAEGAIPGHLLGNMWAQEWGNIYPLVAPADGESAIDVTERLRAKGYTPLSMVRQAEDFFVSLGFEPLPETFWTRSLFVKPRDREVVCHASAWNLDDVDDLRIKMCIDVTAEDFQVIHHELGHNFYQRAYASQPPLFRGSANDGFHEALGDVVALSVTPSYLRQIGLIEHEPGREGDVALLLRDALDKVAFLPFGLLVDQWRWKVFSGDISPDEYNAGWWELRERYQGIAPPVSRTEEHFDPGAKYHIPGNTPYSRYFLARILQFQFHRALCEAAGYTGPLHRCSIYGNAEAGRRLREMMEMGQSRPWPDALEALTGQREMDATALLDYFAPLVGWLEEQNRGRRCGW